MSQFDKICESCDEEFSSFIETVCDDCHDESEKERADEFEKLKKENASLREENEELKIKNQQYLEIMDKFPLSEKQELELQILELETEITSLRESLSLAEQDRDSWKRSHKILQDAAKGEL